MSQTKKNIGIVLLNLGGPTSEDNIKTFLYNLFRDEDIIRLGGGFWQNQLAKLISGIRAKKIVENYQEINYCTKGCTGSKYCFNRQNKVISSCCSPINGLTESQRRSLEKYFKSEYPEHNVKVYTAMRYWLPFTEQIMDEIREDGMDHVVLMPLYPQFSWTTSGSSFREWENVRKDQLKEGKKTEWQEYIVKDYYLNPDYLHAMNDRINEALERFSPEVRDKVHFLFTAHGTPLAEVRSGDPYTKQIEATVEAVMTLRNRDRQYWLGYQSRVGPQKWTQPNTEELVFRLIKYGIKHLVMIPVAFVTDHIETSMELDVELREAIEEEGLHIDQLEVMPGINDHPLFMKALADETRKIVSHVFEERQENENVLAEEKPASKQMVAS
ncbi:MAG: ferrochelatase [Balneolales bacterium]|nr:ferrochelatase [Balneolales bacterium]